MSSPEKRKTFILYETNRAWWSNRKLNRAMGKTLVRLLTTVLCIYISVTWFFEGNYGSICSVACHLNGSSLFCHSNEQCLSPSLFALLRVAYWFRQQSLTDKRFRSGCWNVLRVGESRPKTLLLTYLQPAEVKTNRSCKAVWNATETTNKSESRRINRRSFFSNGHSLRAHTVKSIFRPVSKIAKSHY